MAFTSGELLDMPTGVIGLMRKRSFLLLQSFAGAAGTGLKSFNMVATGTYEIQIELKAWRIIGLLYAISFKCRTGEARQEHLSLENGKKQQQKNSSHSNK